MVNVQEHLKDNNDNLEKKSGSLSATEKGKLEGIKNTSDVVDNAKKTTLDLKLKDGTSTKITAENLIKEIATGVALAEGTNYKTKLENADIKINGKKIDNTQLGRGSEIMAFLQVAAGGNLVPDGKFGASTAKAFSELLPKTKDAPTTNFERVGLRELTTYNFYGDFASVYGDSVAKTYKDTLSLFKSDGTFTNCMNTNNNIVIRYKSQEEQSKNRQSITFKASEIQKPDLNIDNKKLLELVKTKIDANEAKIKKENLKESVGNGVEDLEVKAFTPFMQEYLRGKGRVTNGEVDFKPGIANGSGIQVSKDLVTVNIPGRGNISWKISDVQTSNKFDNTKFVKLLTQTMTPLAQTWKKEQLTSRYNTLEPTRAGDISNSYIIDNYIKIYENLKKDINTYAKDGVVVDKKVVDAIPVKIEGLKNQKTYLVAKNWIDTDIKSFEKRNNQEMSRSEMLTLGKEIEARVASLSKGTLYLTATKVNVKNAFVGVGKTADYNKYFDRYKKLL